MRILFTLFFILMLGFSQAQVIVIHGGAGTIKKENLSPELQKEYENKLKEALEAGYAILKNGGTSLDAVEATIKILEDSPLFNAGKGAVFTNDERNELDASIMDGKTNQAGAVAGVTNVKNPISAARKVMENSKHVMMARKGAEEFAKAQGLEIVEPKYFYTERRYQSIKKVKKKAAEKEKNNQKDQGNTNDEQIHYKFGTVGCVALDKNGNLAAGTSTGGMTNKKYGRVGDSPIIGAGTYANNKTCAVSATGHGEYFIRNVVAYDISALMEYKKLSVQEAANKVINEKLKAIGGSGGVIALDSEGNITMPFNTAGMYRGFIDKEGNLVVKIF